MKLLISAAGPLDGMVGGGQVYVQKLVAELHRRGRDVTVVAAEMRPRDGAEAANVVWREWRGIPVAGVSIDPAAVSAAEKWGDRPAPLLSALRQVVDRVRPDFIHLNGIKASLSAVAIERGIPHAITAHHGGMACPVGTLLRPDDSICDKPLDNRWCVGCYCRQLQGGSLVGEMLARVPAMAYRPLGKALTVLPNPTYLGRVAMYPWLVEQSIAAKQSTIRTAARWIAPSRAVANVLLRNGAAAEQITVVPHGIEPLAPAPLTPPGARPVRFGYVGQINRPKGVSVLIQAFAQLPAGLAELEIIGKPQRAGEREYLEHALRPVAGRSDVTLRGAVAHEQMHEAMARLDVLVLPAIYLEVFGLVLLEAFSVGRPLIVTDCGGPSEIVRNGVDGLIVPPNNVDALTAALRQLAENPAQIQNMAASIRPVRTLAEHVDDLEAIYRVGVSGSTRGELHTTSAARVAPSPSAVLDGAGQGPAFALGQH